MHQTETTTSQQLVVVLDDNDNLCLGDHLFDDDEDDDDFVKALQQQQQQQQQEHQEQQQQQDEPMSTALQPVISMKKRSYGVVYSDNVQYEQSDDEITVFSHLYNDRQQQQQQQQQQQPDLKRRKISPIFYVKQESMDDLLNEGFKRMNEQYIVPPQLPMFAKQLPSDEEVNRILSRDDTLKWYEEHGVQSTHNATPPQVQKSYPPQLPISSNVFNSSNNNSNNYNKTQLDSLQRLYRSNSTPGFQFQQPATTQWMHTLNSAPRTTATTTTAVDLKSSFPNHSRRTSSFGYSVL